jgi:hypothetical protein
MEQSYSWWANSHAANQQLTSFLWNLRVHSCVHKGQPMIPILNQMNPVHTLPHYFPKIHSNIFPSMPSLTSGLFLSHLSNQYIVCFSHLYHAYYMPRPSHIPWFDQLYSIIFSEVFKLWSSSLCSLLQPPTTPPS